MAHRDLRIWVFLLIGWKHFWRKYISHDFSYIVFVTIHITRPGLKFFLRISRFWDNFSSNYTGKHNSIFCGANLYKDRRNPKIVRELFSRFSFLLVFWHLNYLGNIHRLCHQNSDQNWPPHLFFSTFVTRQFL